VKEIATLIVDASSAEAEAQALRKSLAPEFAFTSVDFTNSILKALQSLCETDYHVCFISEKFPKVELEGFFRDAASLNKRTACVFVQVRESVEGAFDRTSLRQLGFTTVISRAGTRSDKQVLKDALQEFLHAREVEKRVTTIDRSLKLVLEEIDRVSRERKRGQNKIYGGIVAEFIEGQTHFDEQVLQEYYEKLASQADQRPPAEASKINVPEAVLARKLPKLEQGKYTGVSHRVWNKLLRHHGVEEGKKGKPDPET